MTSTPSAPSSTKGSARREAIVKATLDVIATRGIDAVTHRAVAAQAGVPLGATTYYFSSRRELIDETVLFAAGEEAARLERLVLELAPQDLAPAEWARAVAHFFASDVEANPGWYVGFYELVLDTTRRPGVPPELVRWQQSHVRLAQLGLRATQSPASEIDARTIVATIQGLILTQLVARRPDFEAAVLGPALERLFEALRTVSESSAAPAP